jgi:hypothetical protein
LADWLGDAKTRVNSLHRHALTGSGRFRVVARAPDGVIEAFEGETTGFSLGVQWHPEYRLTAFDRYVLKTFVDRAASALKSATEEPSRGSSVYDRLSDLGLMLPEASVPPGSFLGAVRSGRVVSGQVPLKDGNVVQTGLLGDAVSIEEGQDCARWALLNALAHWSGPRAGWSGSADLYGSPGMLPQVRISPGMARLSTEPPNCFVGFSRIAGLMRASLSASRLCHAVFRWRPN